MQQQSQQMPNAIMAFANVATAGWHYKFFVQDTIAYD